MSSFKKKNLFPIFILSCHLLTSSLALAMDEEDASLKSRVQKRSTSPEEKHTVENGSDICSARKGFENLRDMHSDILLRIFFNKEPSKPCFGIPPSKAGLGVRKSWRESIIPSEAGLEVCKSWRETLLALPGKYKAVLKNEFHLAQYLKSDFKLDSVHINFHPTKETKELLDKYLRYQPDIKMLNLNPCEKHSVLRGWYRNFYIDIDYLSNHLTKLQALDLSQNKFSADPFKRVNILPFANLTNLRVLKLANTGLDWHPIKIFEKFTSLTKLDISCTNFGDTYLTKNPRIYGDFRHLTNLTVLSLARSQFPLELIPDLINLKKLNLSHSCLVGESSDFFRALPNLSDLNLSRCPNIGLAFFLTQIQKLEKLNLRRSGINTSYSLVLLTALKKLNLEETGLRDDDIKELKKHNPNLQFSYSYKNLGADLNIDLEGKFGEDFYD